MSDKLKVLYVEDDNVSYQVVEAMIKHIVDLERAEDLSEVHDITGVDVMLLDLNLKNTFGVETITKARAAFPNMPIVVLTALDEFSIHAKCRELGCQSYVKGEPQQQTLLREMKASVKSWEQLQDRRRELATHQGTLRHVKEAAASVQNRIDELLESIGHADTDTEEPPPRAEWIPGQ
jgi:DNA-binding response OmpR family regulator